VSDLFSKYTTKLNLYNCLQKSQKTSLFDTFPATFVTLIWHTFQILQYLQDEICDTFVKTTHILPIKTQYKFQIEQKKEWINFHSTFTFKNLL
jgi:hypothetical protein